jgi:hypothetical protein
MIFLNIKIQFSINFLLGLFSIYKFLLYLFIFFKFDFIFKDFLKDFIIFNIII